MSAAAQNFDDAIERLDLRLFDAVPSQTEPGDRTTLLTIQRGLRRRGEYVYLEIGSYLGGTLQPHYGDPRCRRIYAIDKRPTQTPDERGRFFSYPDNSTAAMIENLRRAYPGVGPEKLRTFDADAREVNPRALEEAPDFCFIDGEHTNTAALSDFEFCLKAAKKDSIIAFHDAALIIEALHEIKQRLAADAIPFAGMKLGGNVYALALREAAPRWIAELAPLRRDEESYFRAAYLYRKRLRTESRLKDRPWLLKAYRGLITVSDWARKQARRR